MIIFFLAAIFVFANFIGSIAVASPSPSSRAFEDFENRCFSRVMRVKNALDGMQLLTEEEAERIYSAIGGAPNRDNFEVWNTASDHFVLFTLDNNDRFCQFVGAQVDFQEFQLAFRNWRAEFGDGFRAKHPFELKTRQFGNKTRSSAGIFMVKALGQSDFLQLTISYRPNFLDGFASILLIRLPVKSPAARELFPDD